MRAKNRAPGGGAVLWEPYFRFDGQYEDPEVQDTFPFFYNWNRNYMPEVGRYNRVDQIGFSERVLVIGVPFGDHNTYSYVSSRPLWGTDPGGQLGAFPYCDHPTEPEHRNRNKNNRCPLEEPDCGDEDWEYSAFKWRNTNGSECTYWYDGFLEEDDGKNYTFNFEPSPWNFSHFCKDIWPTWMYGPVYPNQTTVY